MGTAALPIVLTFLLVLVALRVLLSFNNDLLRAQAWGPLARRSLPFALLALMAASLPFVQGYGGEGSVPVIWALASLAALLAGNFFSVPLDERRATRAFRSGDYAGAAALYRRLVEKRPLARYWTFLGAALGAGEEHAEAVDASTRAIELDPKYGLAYYNRALILRRTGRKSRAKIDLEKALDADLPRRVRTAARRLLEELRGTNK